MAKSVAATRVAHDQPLARPRAAVTCAVMSRSPHCWQLRLSQAQLQRLSADADYGSDAACRHPQMLHVEVTRTEWRKRKGFDMDVAGKTILITGSTDGVGRHVALALAAAGAKVLVHGRNRARAERLLATMREGGQADAMFYEADLASLDNVRALVAAVRRDHQRLDVLVNNAGIGTASGGRQRRVSQDGYELRFAVNYLAGFLLARRLLPLITSSAPARIVNVASAGQSPIDFSDVMLASSYDGGRAYTQSKLAQVMFTFDLARELAGSGVTVNCLHPATYMDTTMVRDSG